MQCLSYPSVIPTAVRGVVRSAGGELGWDSSSSTWKCREKPKDTVSFTRQAVLWHARKLLRQHFTEPTASPVPPWCLGEQVKLRVCLEGRGCVSVCREREGLGEEMSCFAETKLLGKPPSLYRCPASRMRQATAVMSAAPLPLPSSDCRKVTSHLGDSCFTVSCMTVEK